jgi:hypothetical protein
MFDPFLCVEGDVGGAWGLFQTPKLDERLKLSSLIPYLPPPIVSSLQNAQEGSCRERGSLTQKKGSKKKKKKTQKAMLSPTSAGGSRSTTRRSSTMRPSSAQGRPSSAQGSNRSNSPDNEVSVRIEKKKKKKKKKNYNN